MAGISAKMKNEAKIETYASGTTAGREVRKKHSCAGWTVIFRQPRIETILLDQNDSQQIECRRTHGKVKSIERDRHGLAIILPEKSVTNGTSDIQNSRYRLLHNNRAVTS